MKTTLHILTASIAALLALSAPADAAQVGNTHTGSSALNTLVNNSSYTGSYNTADGDSALYYTQSGNQNTAVGFNSAVNIVSGSGNVAVGYQTLYGNSGSYNTAVGMLALAATSSVSNSTAIGYCALYTNSSGTYNTAIGFNSLFTNSSGSNNTANGYQALYASTGTGNIGIGYQAGVNLTGGNNNIYIGNVGGTAGGGSATESGTIRIGTAGTHTGIALAGDVYCSAINIISDRNAKERFTPVNARAVLDKVARLPITEWQYKSQTATQSDIRHIGPMAQDFHEAFSVGHDAQHITTVDADGVALAAIQGLNEKLEERLAGKDVEMGRLKAENQALAERLNALEKKLGLGGAQANGEK